ncbi:putative inositol-polyphosphate 5-phosphatase [Helianthus anomalus]
MQELLVSRWWAYTFQFGFGIRKRLRGHINNLKVSPIGDGLMRYMGNKGSVSNSMSLYQTRLCFVCSHLTSGHKFGDEERRNSTYLKF